MQKIKFFLMKLFLSLKHFFNVIEPEIQEAITTTVKILNVVKTWTGTHESLLSFITTLIPSKVDDKIVEKLKVIFSYIPEYYITFTGEQRKIFLHSLSLQIGIVMADGKLSFSDAVYIIQWYFDNHKTTAPPVEALPPVEFVEVQNDNAELHAAALKRIAEAHAQSIEQENK